MCGIAGVWDRRRRPIDGRTLVAMRDVLAHRGPDGAAGVFISSTNAAPPTMFGEALRLSDEPHDVGLVHRRLAIIDLESGDQPMTNAAQSVWVVFNGEIYNYRELRHELEGLGHTFRTASDTEVIVHAYEEYGHMCLSRFNGIFGIAVWDASDASLLLARDPFGVKPLYYSESPDRFAFASEIKGVLAASPTAREVDVEALALCLSFRFTPAPHTLMRSVRKVPPGCCLRISAAGIRSWQYEAPPEPAVTSTSRSTREWAELLAAQLDRAVARQMMSDVPIGLSLSSGVDSATLLALMSRHSGAGVRAFTIGFSNSAAPSEIAGAERLAKQYGAQFESKVVDSIDYLTFMDRYIAALEEPVGNESAAAYHFVAAMARDSGAKVLLNGQGADEAFAGYDRYLAARYEALSAGITHRPLPQLLRPVLSDKRREQFERLRRVAGARSPAAKLVAMAGVFPTIADCATPLRRDVSRDGGYNEALVQAEEWLDRAPPGTFLEKTLWVDSRTVLAENLLLAEDKMSMAASVEARVPFLDLEFMKFAEQVPGDLKLHRGRGKYIHRRACAEWVGTEAANRRKVGFEGGMKQWLEKQLGERLQDLVRAPRSITRQYFDEGYVFALLGAHRQQERDATHALFLLLSIEMWNEAFIVGGARANA